MGPAGAGHGKKGWSPRALKKGRDPANTLILDFRLLELCKNKFKISAIISLLQPQEMHSKALPGPEDGSHLR